MKSQDSTRPDDCYFSLAVNFKTVGEQLTVENVSQDLTIGELKVRLELLAGVPARLQRLQYLDSGDMLDASTLRGNDVVTGGHVRLTVWKDWEALVEVIHEENIDGLQNLIKEKQHIYPEIASVALFMASSKGHVNMIDLLFRTGCDVNHSLASGRTALHAAVVSNNNASCVSLLLSNGAQTRITDNMGKTPEQLANDLDSKLCGKEMFQFNWQKRASPKGKQPAFVSPPLMHQLVDSGKRTWMRGEHAQMYVCSAMPRNPCNEEADAADITPEEAAKSTAEGFHGKYNKTFHQWLEDENKQRAKELRIANERRQAELRESEVKKYQNTMKNEQRQRQWKIRKQHGTGPALDHRQDHPTEMTSTNIYAERPYTPRFEQDLLDYVIQQTDK